MTPPRTPAHDPSGSSRWGLASPTDRFTLDVVRQFAAHGVDHVMVPAFSFDAGKVRQRLEQIATQVIEPYRRG